MPLEQPYPYPMTNSELIKAHSLEKHFEGGFFRQTVALSSYSANGSTSTGDGSRRPQEYFGPGTTLLGGTLEQVKSDGSKKDEKLDATLIHYLLTPESYQGKMHMNLNAHIHLLHSGRALYTLIKPPSETNPEPEVHRIVLGGDVTRGETNQLFVPGGWWKASEIPAEDMKLLDQPGAEEGLKERIGCLISEVVIPGWTPDQHVFIDEQKLKDMWQGREGWEEYKAYLTSAP